MLLANANTPTSAVAIFVLLLTLDIVPNQFEVNKKLTYQ
ncbi:hypothetical protein SPWS13_1048 [Shewanella putrefaciens]|nr:hypothetical protein SPWS13_1048 [Shewanella putrefaciens]